VTPKLEPIKYLIDLFNLVKAELYGLRSNPSPHVSLINQSCAIQWRKSKKFACSERDLQSSPTSKTNCSGAGNMRQVEGETALSDRDIGTLLYFYIAKSYLLMLF